MSTTARLVLETVSGTGLRFRAEAASGRTSTFDSGPEARVLNPVEALVAALGACQGMDVISILRKQRQDVAGYEIEVVAERRPEHPRALTQVAIVHRLRGRDLRPAAIEEAIRLSAEKYCSVTASLAKDVPVVSRYEITPA